MSAQSRAAKRKPRGGRLTCRCCGALVKHAEAWSVTERLATCTCLACKERAESLRDTGWRLLQTPHGPRFHREVGVSLHLDVEPRAGKWIACATRDRRMVGVRCDLPSAAEAARAIEIMADTPAAPLPDEVANG